MVIKVDIQKRRDLFLIWSAVLLLLVGVGGNYYFAAQSALLRVIVLLAIVLSATFMFFRTAVGQKFLMYWQESLVELRKVVWPTKKETIHSTLGVLVMVLIMGMFLWSVDAVLVRMVAWLLRYNGV